MGQMLVPSHLLSHTCSHFHFQREPQIPLPYFPLISGEGLLCLPNVPGLQLVGQSHLQGTAQTCLNPPLLT